MNYRGYTYAQEIDIEEDNRKIFHQIIRPDGTEVEWRLVPQDFMRISPYRDATREEFEQAVDSIYFVEFCTTG